MAGFFPPEWLEELRYKNDIVEIVSQYVTLKPKGKKHWGLCPFHGEKTPSFSVDAEKQFYYCFGCHAGGDVVHFVMGMEKLTFPETIELMAQRSGMDLPERRGDAGASKRAAKEREQLYALNRDAALYFISELSKSEFAMKFIAERGIDKATVTRYGIGYAPDDKEGLIRHLENMGYGFEQMLKAGVAHQKGDYRFDMFRNRVIFPIIDIYGRVIGFGGRASGDIQPKYLNTAETAIFNKRRNIYGLNILKKLRSVSSLVLTEGYMDVVSLSKNGVRNAVATLGTALTKEQARLIKRFCSKAYLAYDGDTAGINAALKAVDILTGEDVDVRVMSFPDGMDPDDYIKANGRAAFEELQKKANTGMEFKLERLKYDYDLSLKDGRMEYAIAAAALLAEIPDPVELERYIKQLKVQTGYSEQSIYAQIGRSGGAKANSVGNFRHNNVNARKEPRLAITEAERGLLAAAAHGYSELVFEKVEREDFTSDEHRRLYDAIKLECEKGEPDCSKIIAGCENADDAALAVRVLAEKKEFGDAAQYINDCAIVMRRSAVREEIEKLRNELLAIDLDTEQRKSIMLGIKELEKYYRDLK